MKRKLMRLNKRKYNKLIQEAKICEMPLVEYLKLLKSFREFTMNQRIRDRYGFRYDYDQADDCGVFVTVPIIGLNPKQTPLGYRAFMRMEELEEVIGKNTDVGED